MLDGAKGIVYRYLNVQDGRSYVGQTTRSIHTRHQEHLCAVRCGSQSPLYEAIRSYGETCFDIEILCRVQAENREILAISLGELEKFYIQYFNSADEKCGYNLALGGIRGKHGERSRRKLAVVASAENLSPETLQKRSASLKGRVVSQETREKLRSANEGKHHSQQTKDLISYQASHRSQETLEKLRIANTQSPRRNTPEFKEMLRMNAYATHEKRRQKNLQKVGE